ncbi:hypothetical protein ACVWYN_001052 [Pedobacter sp. UYP24]
MQTTEQIAYRLVSLCREDKNLDCIRQLYAENATSTESNTVNPDEMLYYRRTLTGLIL